MMENNNPLSLSIVIAWFKTMFTDWLKSIISECIALEFQNFKPQTEPEDELLKIPEVASILGVSIVTIHQWKKSGKLCFHRLGGRVFFKKSEILEALQKIERRRV
jgi:excisionase family DNA binding protein